MRWIELSKRLPKEDDIIVYSCGSVITSCVGRYCGEHDPMPSAPNWLPWENVTHWFKLDEITDPEKHDDK